MVPLALFALGIGAQASDFPPLRETVLESGVTVQSQGHLWRLEFRQWKPAAEANASPQRFFRATCDKRVAWEQWADVEEKTRFPQGVYFKVAQVKVTSKYPVIALRASTGMTTSVDTVFFRLAGDRMVYAGKPPATNSRGPVNYRGRSDQWLFDDYDWYSTAPLRYVLYRLDSQGKLQRVRSWKAPGGKALPDTVRLAF